MRYRNERRGLHGVLGSSTREQLAVELPILDGRAAIVAVVGNSIRKKMNAGISDHRMLFHLDSVSEALHRVREMPTCTLLVSPLALHDNEIALLRKAPVTRIVTVLDDFERDPALLLSLGACGVREAFDLQSCEGWNRLRKLVAEGSDPIAARVAALFIQHLEGAAPGTKRFFMRLVTVARTTRTVQVLAEQLGIVPSTLMSRFHRASLPSPKTFLSATRLVLAKVLLEEPRVSVSSVAVQLQYSSTQAFSRHVQWMLGISTCEFRKNVSLNQVATLFVDNLVVRYQSIYRTFDPFASFGGIHSTTDHSNLMHATH
jgi:AraC-like DNA-binding protein